LDYFVFDVETSGPAPGIHNLLSLGATHVRRQQGSYKLFGDLYVELKPMFPGFHPPAMEIHGLDMERLEIEGLTPREAMSRVSEWVTKEQRTPKERPVFVAHNAPFDWMFYAWYTAYAEVPNLFGHSAIDMKALAMGKLDLPWNQTSLRHLAAMLPGVAPRDVKNLHHAGADARYQAEVFAAMMNLPKR
jgi:DNA polymerase III epsilon subunit-like protein